jgi:serine acetyltransferase
MAGVVIGETAVVGDNVVMLHRVTLGGSGNEMGLRHPLIGHGSLLGAGTTVMGPVILGPGSKVSSSACMHPSALQCQPLSTYSSVTSPLTCLLACVPL